jgi:hypothetical protein
LVSPRRVTLKKFAEPLTSAFSASLSSACSALTEARKLLKNLPETAAGASSQLACAAANPCAKAWAESTCRASSVSKAYRFVANMMNSLLNTPAPKLAAKCSTVMPRPRWRTCKFRTSQAISVKFCAVVLLACLGERNSTAFGQKVFKLALQIHSHWLKELPSGFLVTR